jgi:hypothetical protein
MTKHIYISKLHFQKVCVHFSQKLKNVFEKDLKTVLDGSRALYYALIYRKIQFFI